MSQFKITSLDYKTFKIEISTLTYNVSIIDQDRMFDIEDKISKGFELISKEKKLKQTLDIYTVIEMAGDLWKIKAKSMERLVENKNRVINLMG